MSFSFFEIEQRKNLTIGFLFIFLIGFYFLTAYLIVCALDFSVVPSLSRILWAFIAALIIAAIHWWFSTANLIASIATNIDALPADEKDEYHLQLKKIVEEVCVAIGGRRIEAWVINSASMNAFALEDFKGRAVIGVTEGVLARLNRAQIEAVVAHEAGHIMSGDCLSTTVSCSIAEIYEESISRVGAGVRGLRGRGIATLGALYLILAFMRFLSNMARLFISRQREYRADAISVRLTRNPLSLAEALKLISENWRGVGSIGEKISSIFIVNPNINGLDEMEGFFANLFSTHPPVNKRIDILLDMAHLDGDSLTKNLKNFKRVSPIASAEYKSDNEYKPLKWSVCLGYNCWSQSLNLDEIKKLEGFKPDQWVRRDGETKVRYAYNEPELLNLFPHNRQKSSEQILTCPHCKTTLEEVIYEGTSIFKCSFCAGVLAAAKKVSRILIRKDKDFSAEVVRLGEIISNSKGVISYNLGNGAQRVSGYNMARDPKASWVIDCPQCHQKMRRQFFLYSYPVEVDQCSYCEVYWFDKYELEILQYMTEKK